MILILLDSVLLYQPSFPGPFLSPRWGIGPLCSPKCWNTSDFQTEVTPPTSPVLAPFLPECSPHCRSAQTVYQLTLTCRERQNATPQKSHQRRFMNPELAPLSCQSACAALGWLLQTSPLKLTLPSSCQGLYHDLHSGESFHEFLGPHKLGGPSWK